VGNFLREWLILGFTIIESNVKKKIEQSQVFPKIFLNDNTVLRSALILSNKNYFYFGGRIGFVHILVDLEKIFGKNNLPLICYKILEILPLICYK
jgi:hypothetical protein